MDISKTLDERLYSMQGLHYIIDDDVLFALFIPLCYDSNHVVALIIGGDTYGFTRHYCRKSNCLALCLPTVEWRVKQVTLLRSCVLTLYRHDKISSGKAAQL